MPMHRRAGVMDLSHWYKKDVVLDWQQQRLSLAVSQSLFSSHEVDVGSRLLLRALDLDSLPSRGTAIDFGCGYGVLGLALKQVRPEWTVELIDRDTLAVAFSAWNADQLGWSEATGVRCRAGLGVESAPPEGVDLLLWNVPGKAGQQVLQHLMRDAVEALAMGGLLALVVVNPLASLLREAVADHITSSIEVEADLSFASHTVMLLRRTDRAGTAFRDSGSPFIRGVFDRSARTFEQDAFTYTITPVIGLPEYDSRDHATDCALDVVDGLDGPMDQAILQGVGQGHVPIVVRERLEPRSLVLIDRDVLAIEASMRGLRATGLPLDRLRAHARPDIGPIEREPGRTLVVIMLPDQQAQEVTLVQLNDITALANEPLELLVAGSSTSVTRFLTSVKRHTGWRLQTRRKRHGASAALLSVSGR